MRPQAVRRAPFTFTLRVRLTDGYHMAHMIQESLEILPDSWM